MKSCLPESLVTRKLSCLRIKLSNSQTLKLDGMETGNSLSNFAQLLHCENADVPDSTLRYLTLLVVLQLWI